MPAFSISGTLQGQIPSNPPPFCFSAALTFVQKGELHYMLILPYYLLFIQKLKKKLKACIQLLDP